MWAKVKHRGRPDGTRVAALTAACLWAFPVQAADPARARAPEFAKVEWLNTDQPITLASLRGQVVLLDFWTYCCINCMHIFPDLAWLEEKYRDQPLVVIGVHSGKFSQEKDRANIRQAILRHNLNHPVAVDSEYAIWNAYAARAWPTLVVIDPQGYVHGAVSGEGHRDALDQAIGKLLREHRAKDTLGKPLRFRGERESFTPGALQFPGKVLADEPSGRLFISDTNHHRVLVCDLDGRVTLVVGSGRPGLKDAAAETAMFRQPQGLALSAAGDKLYVADTENHALREIALSSGAVRTLAGNGRQSYDRSACGPARTTALSSPWDVVADGQRLYLAMAGLHQIWTYDLKARKVCRLAGSGGESGDDGAATFATFAQPSGLTLADRRLYVADAEISSIRTVELDSPVKVGTLAGSGELFEFGHTDGIRRAARFQHPLGVAAHGRRLYVADTFNHLVRTVDMTTGAVETWLGTGKPELGTPEAIGLYEPGGLSVSGEHLYIADTNHHRIVRVDLATRAAAVLDIRLPAAPASRPPS